MRFLWVLENRILIRRGEFVRKAFSLLERDVHFITSNAGLKELREEICSYLERKIGVSYDPMQETMVTVAEVRPLMWHFAVCWIREMRF